MIFLAVPQKIRLFSIARFLHGPSIIKNKNLEEQNMFSKR